jgi:hypothetical protein
MKLYRSLGDQLNTQGLDPWTRQELKACRKRLVEMYGPPVRELALYTEVVEKVSPYLSLKRPKGAGVMVVVFGADANIHKSEFIPASVVEDPKLRRDAQERDARSFGRGASKYTVAEETRRPEGAEGTGDPVKARGHRREIHEGDLRYSISPKLLQEAVARLATQVPVAKIEVVKGLRRRARVL